MAFSPVVSREHGPASLCLRVDGTGTYISRLGPSAVSWDYLGICVRYLLDKCLQLLFKMSTGKKSDLDLPTRDHIEEIDQIKLDNQIDQSELSGIESTAASKEAWLISIVVSIGGLLFGTESRTGNPRMLILF